MCAPEAAPDSVEGRKERQDHRPGWLGVSGALHFCRQRFQSSETHRVCRLGKAALSWWVRVQKLRDLVAIFLGKVQI